MTILIRGAVRFIGFHTNIKLLYLLNNLDIYNKMIKWHNSYGDGKACENFFNFMINLK